MSSGAKVLLSALRAEGIRDARVLDAIANTPREKFVDEGFEGRAYANCALPISCGQTISQPYIVAYMTEKLEIEPHMRVLEIGTGSGYQAAVLARLAAEVYTVERHMPLLEQARARFEACGLSNIFTLHGDGFAGWPEKAPFDRIIATAAFRELPESLTEELTESGKFITLLGYETISQRLWKIMRTKEGLIHEALLPVVFVPMIRGLPHGGKSADNEDEHSYFANGCTRFWTLFCGLGSCELRGHAKTSERGISPGAGNDVYGLCSPRRHAFADSRALQGLGRRYCCDKLHHQS